MGDQLHIPIHSHSLEAWYDQILPTINERQRNVLEAIKKLGNATMRDIALYMNVPMHTISGRITELKSPKMNLIKKVGRVKIGDSSFSVYNINEEPNN